MDHFDEMSDTQLTLEWVRTLYDRPPHQRIDEIAEMMQRLTFHRGDPQAFVNICMLSYDPYDPTNPARQWF